MQELYYPSSDGKTNVHACIWQAEGETRAVLQIVHGMSEHALRYAPFAEYLNKCGITVCAEDHLGHGKSVADEKAPGFFADRKGMEPVFEDIRALTLLVKQKYGGVPFFILGHSMGSFFVRNYIARYGGEFSGAIIVGTGTKSALITGTAKFCASLIGAFKGKYYKSRFIGNVAFGSYNKRFEHRTEYDWLSKDAANIDAYLADPLCGIPFSCNAYYGLFDVIAKACKVKTIKATPEGLPVLVMAGEEDPVGDYTAGVEKYVNKLAGYGKDVQMIIYRGCRHEVLNDVLARQAYEDVKQFIESNLK